MKVNKSACLDDQLSKLEDYDASIKQRISQRLDVSARDWSEVTSQVPNSTPEEGGGD